MAHETHALVPLWPNALAMGPNGSKQFLHTQRNPLVAEAPEICIMQQGSCVTQIPLPARYEVSMGRGL